MTTNDLLSSLNPEQREAAAVIDGPVLVLAGAGTGKTRVITHRIAHMLRQGVAGENILGMTFTNKAAKEMQERVASLVSETDAKAVTLGTFHSFCSRVLRKDIKKLGGFNNQFTIAVEADQTGIIRQACGELGIPSEGLPQYVIISLISKAKNKLWTPKVFKNFAETEVEIKSAQVYERYQQILENQNMLDFDDMLLFTVRLWEEHPDVLKKYQDRYQYIMVDEYQDTNMVQYRLLELLSGERKNLCVVGDDDQSIYSWRGAVVENIIDFPNQYPNSKVVKLERNYRSTNTILRAANHFIATNEDRYEKNLWSENGEGEKIKIVRSDTSESEAEFIATAIKDMIVRDGMKRYGDFAILYRSNHLSRLLEVYLRRIGVPYRLVGSKSFYERKEILDAVGYLKILANPRDDQNFLRVLGVPPRGIGDKGVSRLKELQNTAFLPLSELAVDEAFIESVSDNAASECKHFIDCLSRYRKIFNSESGSLSEKTRDFFEDVGYLHGLIKVYKKREDAEKRLENVYELINSIAQFEGKAGRPATLLDFIESFSLMDDNDKVDEENGDNAVTLMTVHASKGLEFPYVFISGMEHNLFPHERSLDEGSLDEERRLFYVAITRAKKELILCHSANRMRFGKLKRQRPSEFLSFLPEDLVERTTNNDFFSAATEDAWDQQMASIFANFDTEEEAST